MSAKRRSSGVAPRACVRVYARVLVPRAAESLHAYIPYGRDCLAHSRSPSTARRACRVAEVG